MKEAKLFDSWSIFSTMSSREILNFAPVQKGCCHRLLTCRKGNVEASSAIHEKLSGVVADAS